MYFLFARNGNILKLHYDIPNRKMYNFYLGWYSSILNPRNFFLLYTMLFNLSLIISWANLQHSSVFSLQIKSKKYLKTAVFKIINLKTRTFKNN